MADNVQVQFGGNATGAIAAIKQVKSGLQELAEPVQQLQSLFKTFAEVFATVFAVEKIAALVEKYGELGEQIERTSAMIGASTKSTQEWGYIANQTGGSAQSFATMAERLQLALARAQNPTSQQAQALAALGLSARELIGLSLDQQMDKIADSVSRFADGGNKTAIVMALLGRNGAAMIPFLDGGSKGLQEMRQRAEETGSVIGGKTVKSLADMEKASKTLGSATQALAANLIGFVSGPITSFLNGLANIVGNIDIAIQAHTLWQKAIVYIETAALELVQVLYNVGTVAKDVFTLNWGQIGADRQAGLDKIAQIQKDGQDKINAIAAQGMATYQKIISEGGGASGLPNAPALNTQAGQQVAAEEKAIDEKVKLWQQWLAQQTAIYDADAKSYQITQDQKYALTIQATNRAYDAELALLKQEETLGNLSVQQKQDILNKIQQLEATHNTQIIKLQGEALAEQTKEWNSFFNTIEGSFNSQLRGLLAGTENWHTAMNKMLGDFVIKFIEGVEKMVFEWVAGEVAKTTATTAGTAARTAAEATAASGNILATIANAIKAIFSGAGQTAAGVSAAVAPVAGPAAPAIGAAAGAQVIGEALPLVPHAIGSWEVPGITPALLHPGEMVIPQPFAEGLRGNGGLGGDQIQVHITAVDAQSVKNLLQGNSDVIGGIVQKYVKRNPSASRGL